MPAKFFLTNANLRASLERILEATWTAFPQLAQNQIALTWIVYEPPYQVNTGGALSAEAFWQYQPQGASYRGIEPIEPAGLVQSVLSGGHACLARAGHGAALVRNIAGADRYGEGR